MLGTVFLTFKHLQKSPENLRNIAEFQTPPYIQSLNQDFQMAPVPYSYIDPSLLDNMKKVDKISYAGNCLGGSTPRLAPTRRHIKRYKLYRDKQEQ